MTIRLCEPLRRAVTRLLLAVATLGFGASGWFVVLYHRAHACIAAALWLTVGTAAFLSIWTETDRSNQ